MIGGVTLKPYAYEEITTIKEDITDPSSSEASSDHSSETSSDNESTYSSSSSSEQAGQPQTGDFLPIAIVATLVTSGATAIYFKRKK